MFLDIDRFEPDRQAVIDEDGNIFCYGDIFECVQLVSKAISDRKLVFSFCTNTFGSLAGYVAFLSNRIVPLLLDASIDHGLREHLINTYRPSYLWVPSGMASQFGHEVVLAWHGYFLLRCDRECPGLYEDLALLLTTSGSTGSPKLVRQSYINLRSNAESIAQYLEIDERERPITSLPMHYVYGLSVINSHLLKGAAILLTTKGIMQKPFWDFFKAYQATSIAGVPYTYEMLKKLRFFSMDLPSLRTMTQAGGKLLPELHKEFAEYALDTGKRFVVMYGAAEATARMGYLPWEKSVEKYGSMGIAIPGGTFHIIDENGHLVEEPDREGELVYTGDNVTLGYANCAEDLKKADENSGTLYTGDMAKRDADGYYYIVGRKKRFLKVFGNKVGLDELERLIKSYFDRIDCACCGVDDLVTIFITGENMDEEIKKFVSSKTGLNRLAFEIKTIEKLPKNEAGKTRYQELEGLI